MNGSEKNKKGVLAERNEVERGEHNHFSGRRVVERSSHDRRLPAINTSSRLRANGGRR